jgi:hypothetical protein
MVGRTLKYYFNITDLTIHRLLVDYFQPTISFSTASVVETPHRPLAWSDFQLIKPLFTLLESLATNKKHDDVDQIYGFCQDLISSVELSCSQIGHVAG